MHNTTAVKDPEICLNLWAYVDEESGLINRVTGRGYVLTGTDEEKLKVLHLLAKSDFLINPWFQVPQNFSFTSEFGTLEGLIPPSALNDNDTFNIVFDKVYKFIDKTVGTQIKFHNENYIEFTLKVPNDPLYVLTHVIEYEDGRLEPVLKNNN